MAIIDGTPNDDSLAGTAGDDTINGFAGNDLLNGDEGGDLLRGGEGNDTFVLVDNEKIENFVVGEDFIQLDGLSSGDAIAYDLQSGDLLLNGTIVAQLTTGLTFESDSFIFDVDQSELTLDIPFVDDGGNGGNNDFVDLSNITFSRRSDVVEENDLILIPGGSFVSTLAGNDLISSVYTTDTPTASVPTASGDLNEAVAGIYNQGSLDTSFGRDVILGNVEYTGEPSDSTFSTYGILNRPNDGSNLAIISTGRGNDKVLGFAASSNSINIDGIGNLSSSEINTGAGRDEVRGEATGNASNLIAGIDQGSGSDATNLITTGNGGDKVIGKVNDGRSDSFIKGIFQDGKNSQIITGNGNDRVIGEASGSAGFIAGIDQEDGSNQITTGNGNDKVVGEASGDVSGTIAGIIQDRGSNQIITGNGNDKVIGEANGNLTAVTFQGEDGQPLSPGIVGISQQDGSQKISTGNGADEVRGTATGTATASVGGGLVSIIGIAKFNSAIETGKGNDKVIGEASGTADQIAGIAQQGSEDLIVTGKGNDKVIGTASGTAGAMAGIAQQPGTAGSQIITGKGNDRVIGTASNNVEGLITAGILGDLDINTGSGNDEVIASAQVSGVRVDGFAADPFTGGSVTVDTGSGNDLVKGFGQGNFDGGKGNRDVYDLSEYSQSEFTIEIGTGENNEVDFIFGDSTASTQGFEVFRFADGELCFSDLA